MRLAPAFHTELHSRLRADLDAAGLDALVLDDPLDVAYVTGFAHFPNERPVVAYVPREGEVLLLVPDLEREYAADQRASATLVVYPEFPGERSPFAVLRDAVGTRPHRAAHAPSTSFSRVRELAVTFEGAEWTVSDLVAGHRMRKTPEEIALHVEAARIADAMVAEGARLVATATGELPTEAELAAHVTRFGADLMHAEHEDVVVVPMLTGGLVYSGANSAQPHRLPGGDRLRRGEPFMLSLGCAVGGRFVESERTFLLGEPTRAQRHYYTVVREAQEVGTEALRPGVRCVDANRACLDVIRRAGLARYLRHRQGHGIGLGFHEPPWVADGDETVLAPGMVLSSEPGLYVPGHAGYRISDTVLVTAGGPRRLTGYPRDLSDIVIGA
ncbi:Xaa-Pro peptidase family protein [Phytohabitans sp. ZYX-F-186]|uniref:Xaa-Pro peptidase family protein n=1 Tax=Phytohabitans maris TaxID=3071409 RepID=A0ABU0ZQ91_9ACTN|nr:Xaa-Pro peptidase family protein [Phytohabitans sp. ZYX-F-186]MDQ7908514.1 Xaa-Pro peptidase family protein [Phytohabitans sp. ZYX-F-186]